MRSLAAKTAGSPRTTKIIPRLHVRGVVGGWCDGMPSDYRELGTGAYRGRRTSASPVYLARVKSEQRCFGVGRDRGTSGWPGTTVRHDRSDPDPRGDRAGRPTGPPSNSSRWSTTNCGGWPPRSWPTRSPGRPSRPRPWSMRRTSDCSVASTPRTGTVGGISSPPRPRPCAASWLTMPAASDGPSTAAIRSDFRSTRSSCPSTTASTTCSTSTTP